MTNITQLNPFPTYSTGWDSIHIPDRFIGNRPENPIYGEVSAWDNRTPRKIDGIYDEEGAYISYSNNLASIHRMKSKPFVPQKLGLDSAYEFDMNNEVVEDRYGAALAETDKYQRKNIRLKAKKIVPIAIFNKYSGHYEPNPKYWKQTY